jgi:hypothetical protein
MDNYNPPLFEAPPEPVPNKFPWPGTISLVMAFISAILTCIMFFMFYNIGMMAQGGGSSSLTGMSVGALALLCGTVTASLIGVGLGIWGTVQKTTSKITGIIGLVINGLVLIGLCCFFTFAIAVSRGM